VPAAQVGVAEGVDGDHGVDQRQAARQVVSGAPGCGHHDSPGRSDLVGREQAAVDRQAGVVAVGTPGYDEVDRRVLRPARRLEQLRRGVPTDGAATPHEEEGGASPQGEGDLDVGGDVDVREEPPEARPTQGARGDQAGGPRRRTPERMSGGQFEGVLGWEWHVGPDGSRATAVP
jgi:hypothetical protein